MYEYDSDFWEIGIDMFGEDEGSVEMKFSGK